MEFRKIEIGDRDTVECIRRKNNHTLLSHSFYTLFLWQDTMQLSIYLEQDFFIVKYELKGSNSYFFPCGNSQKTTKFLLENFKNKNFKLFYLRREDEEFLVNQFDDRFVVNEARDSWEYIFSRQEHLELKGKKYAKIRNEESHLRRFHSLSTAILNNNNISDALKVVDIWEQRHREHNDSDIDDYLVAKSSIDNYYEVGMRGMLIYVDNEPQAIVLGCEITSNTFGIQIAKIAHVHTGLIFFSLHEFFKSIPEQYIYINGDDDLDIAGIRLHKTKMRPCFMNEVWEGSVKQ